MTEGQQKKAGIVADNYKVARFEKELTRLGFEYLVMPFAESTSQIHVFIDNPGQIKQIERLCREVELHFKRAN